MAKNRKPVVPPPEPPAPTTPVVRMSLPVPGGVIRLVHDRADQVHEVRFEGPHPQKLPAAVADLLKHNEVAPPAADPGGLGWT